MGAEFLAYRLLATVPAALGAWLVAALLLGLLRIRDPRVRAAVYSLAALDALLALTGGSAMSVLFVTIAVDPDVLPYYAQTVARPTLLAWAPIAAALLALRAWRARRAGRSLETMIRLFPADGALAERVTALSARLGVRVPALAFPAGEGSPFLVGWLRPVLAVPRGFWDRLGLRGREAMLLHELAHVRRRDGLRVALAGVLTDVLFFNWPLRVLVRRCLREWESSADLSAMRLGASRAALARAIVDVVGSRPAGASLRAASVLSLGGSASAARRRLRSLRLRRRPLVLALQCALLLLLLPWTPLGTDQGLRREQVSPPDRGSVRIAFGWRPNVLTLPVTAPLHRALNRHIVRAAVPAEARAR